MPPGPGVISDKIGHNREGQCDIQYPFGGLTFVEDKALAGAMAQATSCWSIDRKYFGISREQDFEFEFGPSVASENEVTVEADGQAL